jgi:hypothetical protein
MQSELKLAMWKEKGIPRRDHSTCNISEMCSKHWKTTMVGQEGSASKDLKMQTGETQLFSDEFSAFHPDV